MVSCIPLPSSLYTPPHPSYNHSVASHVLSIHNKRPAWSQRLIWPSPTFRVFSHHCLQVPSSSLLSPLKMPPPTLAPFGIVSSVGFLFSWPRGHPASFLSQLDSLPGPCGPPHRTPRHPHFPGASQSRVHAFHNLSSLTPPLPLGHRFHGQVTGLFRCSLSPPGCSEDRSASCTVLTG